MPPEGPPQSASPNVGAAGTQRVTYVATIQRIVERAPDTRSFVLRLPNQERFTFKPGQFISCLLPVGDETIIRPYSIASDPEDKEGLDICLNLVPGGLGSHYLFGLRAGSTVQFTGPWGTFILERPPQAECVFIAEGTGVAPIRPMVHRALSSDLQYPVRLHYGAVSGQHVLFRDEFEAAARVHPQFTFAPLLGESLVNFIERRYVVADTDRSRHFYICGIGAIVPRLRDLLRGAGYERRAVQYEKW